MTWMIVLGMAVLAVPAMAGEGGEAAPDSSKSAPAKTTSAPAGSTDPASGGAEYGDGTASATPTVAGYTARILPNGLAAAPSGAPAAVQHAIWTANQIIGRPYVYGGGHNTKFRSAGYDCSGTVSYALHGARLLSSPLDSSSFMRWGQRGRGSWVTIWTNPGHAFLIIAGIRLDTSPAGDPSGKRGPRWRPVARVTRGFQARHPVGL